MIHLFLPCKSCGGDKTQSIDKVQGKFSVVLPPECKNRDQCFAEILADAGVVEQ